MDVDVKIMGVQARLQYINALKRQLGLTWEDCIIDDRGFTGGGDAWYNAKRAWTAPARHGATHRLVLQDDAIVCPGFLEIVEKAVSKHPTAAWSFYNKHTTKIKRVHDTPYFRQNGGQTGGVALCLPLPLVPEMIRWSDAVFGTKYKHDDSRFGWFCQYNEVPFMGLSKSLVGHRPVETTLPHHHDKRRRCGEFAFDVAGMNFDSDEVNESAWCLPYIWLNEKDPHWKTAQEMANVVKERRNARKKEKQLERRVETGV